MAWLAAAVDWQGADRSESVRILLRPESWQVAAVDGRNAFASWGWAKGEPDPSGGPFVETGLVVLLDGRIDNRDELAAAVGGLPPRSDEELIARAYRCWQGELVEKLVGDFAFVIADEAQRKVLAFRDPSGVRPLAFHIDAHGLIVASDPLQLLRLSDVSRAIDADTVIEHLLRRGTSLERTFFRAIKRLPPGHRLVARAGSLTIDAFLRPPEEDRRLDRPEVVLEELRHRLFHSVRVRARGPRPTAAYLSGGIDSSAIVCIAAELARTGEIDQLVCTLSARYPGLPIDEGEFIRLVTARTGFRSVEWDGTRHEQFTAALFERPEPPFLTEPPGTESLEWSAVVDQQIRVLLDGLGGDEIGTFPGVMDDLGRQGRWATGMARVFERGLDRDLRRRRGWALLRGAFEHAMPRLHTGSRRRRVRLHRQPGWLSRQARELARASLERGWTGGGPFASAAQASVWGRVTAPFFIDTLERLHRRAVFMGVDRRYPFLDRRVVDLVLQVPVDYRLRHPYRRLHQTALDSWLPPQIAARNTKANFDGSLVARVRLAAPIIRETLDRGPWLCEPFVDREGARKTARQALENTDRPSARACETVSKITALELWLRQVG
jgi:asparagine synthase (glutamine-hydrolysing)